MSLVISRFLLAPCLMAMYCLNASPLAYGAVLLFAFVGDVFDGILARRLGVATSLLRLMDSLADTTFYIAIAVVACLKFPNIMIDYRFGLVALLGLELLRYMYDGIKFSKSAAYHMWSAKLWGIFLFLGFSQVLIYENIGLYFELAIYVGIFTNIEGLLASFILKEWQCDVPTVLHAFLRRMQPHFGD